MPLSLTWDAQGTWYPTSIAQLEGLLERVIYSGRGYPTSYALRKNIAYGLQHVEFLDRVLRDVKLTSVLQKQNWKTLLIVGCGIMESLLYFLLVAGDKHAKEEWESQAVFKANPKDLNGQVTRLESLLFRKLDEAVPAEMGFEQIIRKADQYRVLWSSNKGYAALQKLRKVRNRVHLQKIGHTTDTDWNAIEYEDVCLMAKVLHSTFTHSLFHPTSQERHYFDYLTTY